MTFAPGYVPEADPDDATGEAARALVAEAVDVARAADVVVLFLGLPASYESEGYDREHTNLPPEQLDLLDAVVAANPQTVVVLANGSVVNLEPWQHTVPAVLEGWLGGQAGGSAVADLLTGVANPCASSPRRFPCTTATTRRSGTSPASTATSATARACSSGTAGTTRTPCPSPAAFGHGLSYTTFGYSDLRVETRGNCVDVRVTITNTGDVAGSEVVQVYVADVDATVFRPDAELKGFARVTWNPARPARCRSSSTSGVLVLAQRDRPLGRRGRRVRDPRRRLVARRPPRHDGDAARRRGDRAPAARLRARGLAAAPGRGAAVRERIDGTPWAGMLFDPQHGAMMRAIPLLRLTRFPGFPIARPNCPA